MTSILKKFCVPPYRVELWGKVQSYVFHRSKFKSQPRHICEILATYMTFLFFIFLSHKVEAIAIFALHS